MKVKIGSHFIGDNQECFVALEPSATYKNFEEGHTRLFLNFSDTCFFFLVNSLFFTITNTHAFPRTRVVLAMTKQRSSASKLIKDTHTCSVD